MDKIDFIIIRYLLSNCRQVISKLLCYLIAIVGIQDCACNHQIFVVKSSKNHHEVMVE